MVNFSLVILDLRKNQIIPARDLNNSMQIYFIVYDDKFIFFRNKTFPVLTGFKPKIRYREYWRYTILWTYKLSKYSIQRC